MIDTHLFALIPLLFLLVISMIWYGRGLLHVMGFAYVLALGYMIAGQGWEMVFLPMCIGSGVIFIILFAVAMAKGDWL